MSSRPRLWFCHQNICNTSMAKDIAGQRAAHDFSVGTASHSSSTKAHRHKQEKFSRYCVWGMRNINEQFKQVKCGANTRFHKQQLGTPVTATSLPHKRQRAINQSNGSWGIFSADTVCPHPQHRYHKRKIQILFPNRPPTDHGYSPFLFSICI